MRSVRLPRRRPSASIGATGTRRTLPAPGGAHDHQAIRDGRPKLSSTCRICIILALSALAVAAAAPTAGAGPLVEAAPPCEERTLERPFLHWLDLFRYELAPGGRFEGDGEGWELSNATLVDGNEPFHVHDPDDQRSLEILPGGWAQTPVICVGIEHPTVRFFAERSGSLAPLIVEVLFEDATGGVHSLPIGGALLGHSSWEPTLPLPVVVNLLPLLPGEHTPVAFRFSAGDGATWRIDDVNVDPYRK